MKHDVVTHVTATTNRSVFSLINSAVNITLPALAAERRAVAPLMLGAGA